MTVRNLTCARGRCGAPNQEAGPASFRLYCGACCAREEHCASIERMLTGRVPEPPTPADAPTPARGVELPAPLAPATDHAAPRAVAPERLAPPLTPVVVRGRRYAWRSVVSKVWGAHWEPGEDPDGVLVDEDRLTLPADFAKVPADAWQAVVAFFFRYLAPPRDSGVEDAPDSVSEATVVFARQLPDFRRWRAFVPRQTVGAANARADRQDLIDILTGERFRGWPEGWVEAGTSHSHNRMDAFFSGTDNENELGCPGIHIVVGRMAQDASGRRYTPLASVVRKNQRRYLVPFRDVVEHAPVASCYHPDVVQYVTRETDRTRIASPTTQVSLWQGYEETREHGRTIWRYVGDRAAGFHGGARRDDVRRWLDSKTSEPLRARGKLNGPGCVPPGVAFELASARAASDRFEPAIRNAIRAFCNAIERCSGDADAVSILEDIADEMVNGELYDRHRSVDSLIDEADRSDAL